jgi:hypothetical protein
MFPIRETFSHRLESLSSDEEVQWLRVGHFRTGVEQRRIPDLVSQGRKHSVKSKHHGRPRRSLGSLQALLLHRFPPEILYSPSELHSELDRLSHGLSLLQLEQRSQ